MSPSAVAGVVRRAPRIIVAGRLRVAPVANIDVAVGLQAVCRSRGISFLFANWIWQERGVIEHDTWVGHGTGRGAGVRADRLARKSPCGDTSHGQCAQDAAPFQDGHSGTVVVVMRIMTSHGVPHKR